MTHSAKSGGPVADGNGSTVDDVVLSILRPLSCYLSIFFPALTLLYACALPAEGYVLTLVAGCTSLLMVITCYLCGSSRFRNRSAHLKLSLCMLQILTFLLVAERFYESTLVEVLSLCDRCLCFS